MDAGLAGSNYDLVKKTFDWATNDSKVRYVAILDEDDAVLFDHNPDELQVDTGALLQAGSTVRQGGLLRTSHPIEYDGERYGNVVLACSLEEAMSEIWSETMLTVFINLLILGMGIGAVLWLSGRIAGRIRRVRDGAQAVSDGNLDVEVPVQTDDEIGELAGGFNEMIRDIRTTQEALEDEKASVERRVEEAVRESEQQKERLQESVDTMLEAIGRFADGDLTVRLPTGREGAIGRLFEGFNEAVAGLRSIVGRVREAAGSTASATEQISASSEQMAASAEEQSAQAEEVAAAVEQLNQTIGENARSVQKTAEVAQAGGETARQGGGDGPRGHQPDGGHRVRHREHNRDHRAARHLRGQDWPGGRSHRRDCRSDQPAGPQRGDRGRPGRGRRQGLCRRRRGGAGAGGGGRRGDRRDRRHDGRGARGDRRRGRHRAPEQPAGGEGA
ncbi:methyl-accepting chemotaxis protein [Salinibacter ruber]|nr:methyl-accepting chemotaxis protein [Salinibacter ruber]